ncbi:MAG TPA: peptide methionine sulfoxide reductase [Gammaproteobacteria bacterium]|nr:peptide methionine sulfoxide reductase [Gammaproteobacteria bacterium]
MKSLCILLLTLSSFASARSLLNNSPEANLANNSSNHVETIVFGAGCFWGVEKRTAALDGVMDVVSGYANGHGVKPEYKEIIKSENKMNPDNFAEVVKVKYNANKLNLEMLLQHYFESHDPTQLNRQGNDIGTQYRSVILTTTSEQATVAKKVLDEYQVKLTEAGYGDIKTLIEPLENFYVAEEYHQDYLKKNPNGYCPDHSTGVTFKEKKKTEVDNTALLKGKHVVVIESEQYCPYCEKFKENVLNDYKGTIPVVSRLASQLDKLEIKTPTWATPTILFVEDGKEVFGQQGYMTPEAFYKALGSFKLGDTEAYNVAFQKGTDGRFCKQYEIFKNTPDGVFIDKLSGQPLFDTRDRFDSGTGWLSFTKPIDGAVTEHEDKSYGMDRVEIKSASSGIHLGHVFPDGPDGMPRYCINATVLEFVPRSAAQ